MKYGKLPNWEALDKPYRRTGRSTRMVDKSIQEFFENGFSVVYDHHPTKEASDFTFRIFMDRLVREHQSEMEHLFIDKKRFAVYDKRSEKAKVSYVQFVLNIQKQRQ